MSNEILKENGMEMANNGVVITESSTPLPPGVKLPIYMDYHHHAHGPPCP